MTEKEVLKTIKSLACSQGFYGRMYEGLASLKETSPEDYEAIMDEYKNAKDSLDLVMMIEC